MESVITMVKMVNVASTLKYVHALWEICPSLLSLSQSPRSHWWSCHHCGLVPTSCIFMLVERIVWSLSHSISLWSIYTRWLWLYRQYTHICEKLQKAPNGVRVLGSTEMEPWPLPHLTGLFHRGCEVSCVTWVWWQKVGSRQGKGKNGKERKSHHRVTTEWLSCMSVFIECVVV